MRTSLLVSTIGLCAVPGGAQATFTSPPGAYHLEGNSSSGVLWGGGAGYQARIQQSDANFVGETRLVLIRAIAWRRDGVGAAAGLPRTADFTMVMAHNDHATFQVNFASNYKDAPVTVFVKKTITLPDWSPLPGPPPSPFDLVIPFDVPWVYNRVDALLWEGIVSNMGSGGPNQDDWFSTAATVDWSMTIQDNAGCTTPNGPFKKRDGFRINGTSLELGWEIQGGPANAAVSVLVGATLISQPLPGLCAPVGVLPLLTLPVGTTSAVGAIPLGSLLIPWNPAFAGAEVAVQGAAPDSSQAGMPIAVSNATRTIMPKVLGSPGLNCKRTFSTTSATATAGGAVTVSAAPVQYRF